MPISFLTSLSPGSDVSLIWLKRKDWNRKIFLCVPSKTDAITADKGFHLVRFKLIDNLFQLNDNRIEFMWNEELLRKGFENASLRRVAWRFVRTRVLVGILVYFLSLVCGFIGPVSQNIVVFKVHYSVFLIFVN